MLIRKFPHQDVNSLRYSIFSLQEKQQKDEDFRVSQSFS